MAKYRIYGTVTGSKYLGEVEAESKEEAEEAAWEQLDTSVSLCWQCSGEINDPEIDEVVADAIEEGGGSDDQG